MNHALNRAAGTAVSLDAVLSGLTPPPSRHDSPFRLLELLVAARCPRDRPRRRDVTRFGDDDVVLALWQSAHTLVEDVRDQGWQEPRRAHTAFARSLCLLETCERLLQDLDERLDLDPEDLDDAVVYRTEVEQLAGAAAGSLAECGDRAGWDYCRERAAWQCEHGQDGYRYAAALLGLSGAVRWSWRPGQPGLGALAAALQSGDVTLHGAVRAAAPEEEPAPKEPEKRPPPAAALTLEVFPDLSHLPGKKRADSSLSHTQQSPLAEHGHLAKKALPLVPVPDLPAFVAALDAEFPWYREVTRSLAADLGRGRFARFRNVLLHGKPGSAKTRYARRAMELAGLQTVLYSAAGASDSTWGSTSRQWSTGRLSTVAGLIARAQQANVGIVLDELDKLPPQGVGGQNGRLDEVLLGYLETTSSRAIFDTYVEAQLDLSAVSYLATANDLSRVSGPLRDRFRLIEAPLPTLADLPVIARTMHLEILAEQGLDPAWAEPLAQDEIDILASRWRGGSLRGLRRMVEVLVDGRPAGAAH